MKITVLVDNLEYVRREVCQHQFFDALDRIHQLEYVEFNDIHKHKPTHDNVLVAMRFRNTMHFRNDIAIWLDGRNVVVQDNDPWTFFNCELPYDHGYDFVSDAIHNVRFACSSEYWARIIEKRTGKRAFSYILGVRPEYCKSSTWESRTKFLEFRGSSYPLRERQFAQLSAVIPVTWDRNAFTSYDGFFDYLSTLKIFAYNENEQIVVDNVSIPRNSLWPKALEVSCRGTFLIRNKEETAHYYEVDKLPTCFLYDDVLDARSLLDKIITMPSSERNDRIEETVKKIRCKNYYVMMCNDIPRWFDAQTT